MGTEGLRRYEIGEDAKKGICSLAVGPMTRSIFGRREKNDMQHCNYALARIQLLYDVERKS